nr:MATE family efflux transporter [uncultured Sphaerochaeta sp.]
MKDKGDFSQGSIVAHLLRLALPVMMAEFVHVLYNIVDRMFLGHMPGTGSLALSGVGIVFPLVSLINAFAYLCGTGSAPLCAIARGKKKHEEAQAILDTAFSMLILIGALLIVILYPLTDIILLYFGADDVTLPFAADYFRYYLPGTIFILISTGLNPIINMQGNSFVGMGTVLIGAVLNIILDPILIFQFNLGIKGAAIASVISQFVSAVWVILFLTSKHSAVQLKRFTIQKELMIQIVKLGVTGFMFKITNSFTQVVCNITLRAYGGALGTLYIGSMSIINSIREIVGLPAQSITNSGQSIESYNYGGTHYSRVRRTIKLMLLLTFTFTTLSWLLIQLFPETLIAIFTDDLELISLSVPNLRMYFACFFMMALQMVGQNTFIAHNCPRRAVFFSLFRKAILVIPLTLILPRTSLGVDGVFIAEASSQFIGASLCFFWMYISIYRKLRKTPNGKELEV